MDGYLATIIMFAGNFAPRGWAFCQAQLLSIAQNTALFSLLGTTYGGNGQTTFGLPDLRGRVPVGAGQGPGLPSVTLGEMAGENTHTLINPDMPAHVHPAQLSATSAAATSSNPSGNSLAAANGTDSQGGDCTINIYGPAGTQVALNGPVIGVAGGSQPHNNMQPYLGMNYVICMEGIFPSRN